MADDLLPRAAVLLWWTALRAKRIIKEASEGTSARQATSHETLCLCLFFGTKLCVCACFMEYYFVFVFVFLEQNLKLLLGKRCPVKLCVCACFLEQIFMFVFVFLNKILKLLLGKRWPTLSFSCQKQEKCLLLFRSRRAKSTHCDHFWKVCKTAEGGRDAAVLTLYKSRGEAESWKRCVWRERERERERESTWAMGSPEQCTRGPSQLRRSFFD